MPEPVSRAPLGPPAYSPRRHAEIIAEVSSALTSSGAAAHLRCQGACLGYHRGWVLLQRLGLISGLASERGFMVAAIRALSAERPLGSVLIACCADFGLLSVVHEALGAAIAATRIMVLDRCETPLGLNHDYAARLGFEIECRQCDLLRDPPPSSFDLVLMHSLLSFCPPEDRGMLMAGLAAPLAGVGAMLVYQSIRPALGSMILAYGEDEIAALVRRARMHCGEAAAVIGLSEDEIADHIRAFCRAKTTFAVPSLASIVKEAESRGLAVRHSRLLFDSRSSAHRAATPDSYYLKYELRLGRTAGPVVV